MQNAEWKVVFNARKIFFILPSSFCRFFV